MSFSKICFFCIKSHNWGTEEFRWVAPPECNTAKLCNECFPLFTLSSFYKARTDTLPGEAKQWNIFRTTIVTFGIEVANFENYIASENGHRIKTAFIKINDLGVILLEKNSMRHNAHNFFVLSLVFLKLLIVGVAFFLGHPVLPSHSTYYDNKTLIPFFVWSPEWNKRLQDFVYHMGHSNTESPFTLIWTGLGSLMIQWHSVLRAMLWQRDYSSEQWPVLGMSWPA